MKDSNFLNRGLVSPLWCSCDHFVRALVKDQPLLRSWVAATPLPQIIVGLISIISTIIIREQVPPGDTPL